MAESVSADEETLAIREQVRAAGWAGDESTPNNQDAEHVWAAQAPRYVWDALEYGEVTGKLESLEKQLFHSANSNKAGENLEGLNLQPDASSKIPLEPINTFQDANLHPVMLENIELCKYTHPTPIQRYCIPHILKGMDVVATAQTGSGKTLAYLIPIISRLMGHALKLRGPRPACKSSEYDYKIHRVRAEPLVLIVVPTRELAIQILNEVCRLCYRSMLRPCAAYGMLPLDKQLADLGEACDILIASPGRLCDLLQRPNILSFNRLKYTIIDEADELMKDDWEQELRQICAGGTAGNDADNQFIFLSATFPRDCLELAYEYLSEDRAEIYLGRTGSSLRNEQLQQRIMFVDRNDKNDTLYNILIDMNPQRTLVFANSRIQVDKIESFLYDRGFAVSSIHSERNQKDRETSLREFRDGLCKVLVSTAVSGRGWDIPGLELVINYDLPSAAFGGITNYTHQIGRTGRIGNVGTSISFYNDRNDDIAKDLANVLLESGCEVPDFLSHHIHEDGQAHFDDEEGLYEITNAVDDLNITNSSDAEPKQSPAKDDQADQDASAEDWQQDVNSLDELAHERPPPAINW